MSAAPVERVHGDGCECQRCRGFEPGNELRRKHGAYAGPLGLSRDPDYGALVEDLRDRLPVCAEADELAVQLLGLTTVRIRRAAAALDEVDRRARSELTPYVVEDAAKLERLRQDLRGWVNSALRLADALAMTPTARARLGVDLARIEPSVVRRMQDEARERDR